VYVLTVFSVVLEIVGVPPGHLRGPGDSWILPKHSFERTLPWHDDDETWLLSAASMPMQDRVLLMPAIADRHAFLWNKKVIQSTDFEVVFAISGSLPRNTQQDGSLAFWMGTEDCTKSFNEKALVEKVLRDRNMDWRVGLKELGYSENGHRPDFKGIAVIFLPFDRDRKLRQTVAAVFSDGTRPIPTPLEDVLKDSRATVVTGDWLPDKNTASTQVKVRVHADGSIVVSKRQAGMDHLAGAVWSWAPDGQEVKGTFVLQPDNTLSWKGHPNSGRWNVLPGGKLNITLFEANFVLRLEGNRAVQELPDFPVRAIAYLGGQEVEDEPWQKLASFPAKTLAVPVPNMFYGFTGYSGTKFGMEVNLNYLGTFNHDPHVVGEDGFSIAQSQQWKAALADEARFIDRVSQREAIERLTKLLADHVAEEGALEEAIRSDLVTLDGRLEHLSADVGTYLAATEAWSPEDGQLHAEAIKNHLGKVKTLLTTGKEVNEAALQQARDAASRLKDTQSKRMGSADAKQKVQSVVDQSQTVKDYAAAGSSQNQLLFVLIVVCVSVLGAMFFNRMRYYEKKHFI